MFYTLVSKKFIKNIRTQRDYLYIFLTGSIGYISIHWYLHMDNQTGIKQTVKNYLYYIMILDAFVAYSMIRMNVKTHHVSNTEEVSKPNIEYTPEQKMLILQKMQEARQLQQQKHKEQLIKQTDEKENKAEANDVKDSKPSIFTKSDESNEESSNKKTSSSSKKKETVKVIKKVSENVDDTEIPVYKNS
jgi:transcriptional regulator of acetoin/glycerol metabolism